MLHERCTYSGRSGGYIGGEDPSSGGKKEREVRRSIDGRRDGRRSQRAKEEQREEKKRLTRFPLSGGGGKIRRNGRCGKQESQAARDNEMPMCMDGCTSEYLTYAQSEGQTSESDGEKAQPR